MIALKNVEQARPKKAEIRLTNHTGRRQKRAAQLCYARIGSVVYGVDVSLTL
jgi:hypothetical protein